MALLDWTNDATRAAYEVVADETENAPQADLAEKALRSATSIVELALALRQHVLRLLTGDEPEPELGCDAGWACVDWSLVNWTEVAGRLWLARATQESAPNWPIH